MSVSDGQNVDAAVTNAAFMSRTANTTAAGTITSTNTTSSTDKDTGAIVTEGGIGVEENVNVGGDLNVTGNATITGDLTVDGTMTSQNVTTFEVEDANITLNNGGTQATADAQDSGFTVEMSDATDAQIGYDSTSATRFIAGEVGSESPVVTEAASQTLTNKTIAAGSNTISGLTHGSEVDNPTSGVHGVTGDVVGTTDSQVLTGKDYDGGTASNTSRLTVPQDTTANLTALTRKEATLVYSNDEDKLYVDDGSSLNEVGGGAGSGVGGINYLEGDDFNFEGTVGNWTTYDDGAVSEPVDGTGGSPSVVTVSRITATPLVGTGMLRISKSAADGQGEGASVDLTAENAFASSVNKIEFLYDLSTAGNFTTGADSSLQIFLYDVTGASLVPLSNEDINSASGKFRATFVGTGSTSYRLIFHVTDTDASAWNFDIDNVVVGPNEDVRGVPASDWSDPEVLTIGAVTTAPTKGTIVRDNARWRRVGDSMEIMYEFEQSSAGTSGSGDYLWPIPGGFSVDTAKLSASTDNEHTVGHGIASTEATGQAATSRPASVVVHDANNLGLSTFDPTADRWQRIDNVTFPLGSTPRIYSFRATVPISGWSSDVSLASGSTFNMSNVLANGTQLTSGVPTKLGEYAVFLKTASTSATMTYDATAAPITAADGMRLYTVNYATGGTAGQPNKYSMFVGKRKHVEILWYRSSGKTGQIDTSPIIFSSNAGQYGAWTSYDDTTGVLVIECPVLSSGTSSRSLGTTLFPDNTPRANVTDGYFEVKVSENAQAVGTEAPRSEIRLDGGNGYGSTATKIRRYTNITSSEGAAITYADSATNGASFTINEDGVYAVSVRDSIGAATLNTGISLNASSLTTNISSLAAIERVAYDLMPANGALTGSSWTGLCRKGDVIRPHDVGTNTGVGSANVQFYIVQVSK